VARTGSGRLARKSVIVASIALAFGLADVPRSFAECGGYCAARHVRAVCHDAVARQDLGARERDAEFEKCKADPSRYLVETVPGGAGTDFE
jgi:hypothetical protein